MADIKKIIDAANWQPRTKVNRTNFISKLRDELAPGSNGLVFLNDFDNVSKYLLTKYENPSTRKNKILDIRAVLLLDKDTKIVKKYDVLNQTLIKANDTYKNDNTVKDSDRFVPYEELQKYPQLVGDDIADVYGKIFLSLDEIDDLKTTKAKVNYLKALTEYITICLYVFNPPLRADYGVTQLNIKSDTKNWYDQSTGTLYLNDFKNVKSFGSQHWKLTPETIAVLDKYIKILKYLVDKPEFLLYQHKSTEAKPFTREKFSTFFKNTNKKYFKKPLTINDYRHIYESHVINSPGYNELTIEDKQKIHDKLLHSAATAQSYIKVNNPISLAKFEQSI